MSFLDFIKDHVFTEILNAAGILGDSLNVGVLRLFLVCYGTTLGLLIICYFLGSYIIRTNIFNNRLEKAVFLIPLGLGILSTFLFILGVFGLFYIEIIYFVMIVVLAINFKKILALIKKVIGQAVLLFSEKKYHLIFIVSLLLFLLLIVPMVTLSIYPETTWDSSMYHLVYSKSYLESHHIAPVENIRHPVFAQLFDLLYAITIYSTKTAISAKVLHFTMLFLCAIVIYTFCTRYYSKKIGIWSSLVWLSVPLVIYVSATAYIDTAQGLFVIISIYALINWMNNNKKEWLIISAISLGFLCGIKYTGLFFVLFCGLVVLLKCVKQKYYMGIIWFSVLVTVTALPWYLYNYVYTGNPLFPFYQNIFGYYDWSKEEFNSYNNAVNNNYGMGKGIKELLLLPWNLIFNYNNFFAEAEITIIYLVGLPFFIVVAFKDKISRILLLLTISYMMFWFSSSQVYRYIIPILPVFSIGIIVSMNKYLFSRQNSLRFLLLLSILIATPGWLFTLNQIVNKGKIPVTKNEIQYYYAQHVYAYPAIDWLNKEKGRDYKLYSLYAENLFYYADGYILGEWQGHGRYSNIVSKLNDSKALFSELKKMGIGYFLYTTNRVPTELAQDPYFMQHFKMVYAKPQIYLYELTDSVVSQIDGDEILKNSNFEIDEDGSVVEWKREDNSIIQPEKKYVFDQNNSVSIDVKSSIYQTVPVKNEKEVDGDYLEIGNTYRFSLNAKSLQDNRTLRVQISWLNDKGKFVYADIDNKIVTTQWGIQVTYITIPNIKGNAVVYVRAPEGSIFVENISIKRIDY
jgi:hypothetical protein